MRVTTEPTLTEFIVNMSDQNPRLACSFDLQLRGRYAVSGKLTCGSGESALIAA